MCSRVAGSLCHALDMPQMVVDDMHSYVERAVSLGQQRVQLLELREELWQKRIDAPLFNTRLWTREWEQALLTVWRRHAAGLPPDHIQTPELSTEEAARVVGLNAEDEAARQAVYALDPEAASLPGGLQARACGESV